MGWDVQKSPPIHLDPVGVSCLRCTNSWSSMKCLVPNSDCHLKRKPSYCQPSVFLKLDPLGHVRDPFLPLKLVSGRMAFMAVQSGQLVFGVVVYPIRCLSPVFFISFQNISTETQIVNINPPPRSLDPWISPDYLELPVQHVWCSPACSEARRSANPPCCFCQRRRRSMQHQQSQSICKFTTCHFLVNSLLVNSRLLFLLPRVTNCCFLRWRTKIHRNKTL